MKTISPGLSDSIASVLADPRPCPHCHSSSHISGGLCVGCLLEAGLDPEDEGDSESLVGILAEINLPDRNWRLGNYEILEEIGRGGMGVIYRARQRHSRRIVAVKRVLSYHSDSRETLARFRREAQAAASLDHPNILPIYEVSESEDGLPFFSMKFAPGGTLQQVAPALRSEPRQCVALVAKIARAVQYAHGHGILHRDLKPGNILLDARGEPLVSDFGLAKWLDTTSDLTRTLTIFGTPGYIAPEQASHAAAELKPTADVYSLGAILFDLLAGRPPFLGTHALSVIRQASELPAPKLRSLSKIADRDLETICSRCLEREPAARYRSAHDLAEDLERWLEGRPIVARPVSPVVKLWRWAKRNPKLAGTAAAGALCALVAVSAFLSREHLGSVLRTEATAARSIAILPFEDLDEATSSSARGRSLADRLETKLSAGSGVSVIRVSDRLPSQLDLGRKDDWHVLGNKLGVRHLLTATIRTRGKKSRVCGQLIDVASGAALKRWIFEEDSEAAIITNTAQLTVTFVGAHVSNNQLPHVEGEIPETDHVSATTNPMAKNYYMSALELRSRLNVADFDRAIALFEKAIEEDPKYAAAYAMLASACQSRSELDPSGPWVKKGNTAAEIAVRLSPTLGEAQRAQAGILRYRGQLEEALDTYLIAYELDQSSDRAAATIGNVEGQLGRPHLALKWYEKAVRRQSRPGIYAEYFGDAWSDLGEEARAEKAFRTATIFRPDLAGAAVGLARLALLKGDFDRARSLCAETLRNFADDWDLNLLAAEIEFYSRDFETAERLYRRLMAKERSGNPLMGFGAPIRFGAAVGFIQLASGRESEGKRLLLESLDADKEDLKVAPKNPRLLYSAAAICAALNQTDQALNYLRDAVEGGWIDYRSLSLDPRFDSIRRSPAYERLLSELKNKVMTMDAIALERSAAVEN
jgi:tetratricopeptide (TPR) repeat protein/TolB-like protein/tRNA A-37 threonylcarbamoyl transferase component Bud32